MPNTYTFGEAIDDVYSSIGEGDRDGLISQILVKRYLNMAHTRIAKGKNYRFLNKTVVFNTSIATTLGEAIDTNYTDFDVALSTGLPSTGTVVIGQDLISYTGNVANNLSGVTGIESTHDSGDSVQRVYNLVNDLGITDFDKPTYLSVDDKEILYYDGRGGLQSNKYKLDKYDNLYLPKNSKINPVVFKYKLLVSKLVDDADLFVIPDDWSYIITEYAIYRTKVDLGFTEAREHLFAYKQMLKEMRNDYGTQTENNYRSIKTIYQPYFNSN